jgi:Ca-activated chloride channel homolog
MSSKIAQRWVILLAVLGLVWLAGSLRVSARRHSGQSQTQQDPKRPAPAASPTPPSSDDGETLDPDDVVRIDTELTNILFTAVDKQKRFITTLKKEDVTIFEDGKQQEIFTFARQTDLPLSLAIVLDTSVSMERVLPAEREAASSFVNSVLRSGKDEAAVLTFTGETTLELGLTGSASRVRSALDRVRFTPPAGYIGGGTIAGTPPISDQSNRIAGSTAVWDAVWVTADEVLSGTLDRGRRAIILLTDGMDYSSQKKLDEAIDKAVKAEVVVYSIGIGDNFFEGINEGVLRKLSERTGGHAYFPRNEDDLRAAFAQIELELRSQYLLAYAPTNKNRDNTFRRIKIEVANPDLQRENLRLNYRQGYFAKGPGSSKDTSKRP